MQRDATRANNRSSKAKVVLAIRFMHGSIRQFARDLGCARQGVSAVVHGHATSVRIATAAAALIGATPDQVWPKRYTPEGLPANPHYRPRRAKTEPDQAGEEQP